MFVSSAQRVGVCNTSGSGTDVPGQSGDVEDSHGPLPQNTSLFMGFAFMLTASSETDRLTNKLTSEDEEGETDCASAPPDLSLQLCQINTNVA